MFVLIAGGGRTGARLANLLINENYKVRLIEHRRELLGRLHQELPTEVIYEVILLTPLLWKRLASVKCSHWRRSPMTTQPTLHYAFSQKPCLKYRAPLRV